MRLKNIPKLAFVLLIFQFTAIVPNDAIAQQLEYLEYQDGEWKVNKEKYNTYIANHPFNNRPFMSKEDLKAIPKTDRPDLAYEYDWLITQDPKTGDVPWQRLLPELRKLHGSAAPQTVAPGGSATNKWVERGPNNIGGRTRGIMFDPKDATNKKVWAGGVGGGLWYNNDITSSSSSWNSVNDFWANLAITTIAYDPTATSTFYVGTGEGWRNSDAIRGAGIWKSSNAGTSWAQLSSTNNSNFYNVQKIIVSSTGRVIAVTSAGIYTSDNDGISFTRRRSGFHADIEQASNGVLFASTGRIFSGGKIYKSTNDGNSWTDITPTGGSPQRIELACAPSDSNTVYAVASNSQTSAQTDVEWFKKSTNGGSTWTNVTIPKYLSNTSKHFTRGQAWYDLILWVHPTDKNVVIAGGVDLHRSTNGGTSWTSISYWNSSQSKPVVHADQHNVISRPGNNNEILIGNDGGVYYSTNAGNKSTSSPTFSHRVKNYNVTQFYSAAMHPTSGSNYMLAGAQDNGSLRLNASGVSTGVEVTGGDGAFCFIDQDNANYQITSYVRNNWRRSTNGGVFFSVIQSGSDGSFINPADYDDNKNILYSAKSTTQLNRISNMTSTTVTTGAITVSGMSSTASHVRVSPYTTTSSTLFVGSGGDVYKVLNADGNSPTASKISPSTFPSGNISCVEIGASENELLVTFSNYGITSVWYTSNGGTTWINKEGNLPDMPVRWALFNPKNRKEVILGTELGIYATDDISASTVVWSSSNQGMAITRVDMLQYRSADSLIMVSTHGRGVFTGRFKKTTPPSGAPTAKFGANKTNICAGDTITFTDSSTNNPTSLKWTFTGGTANSTTSSSPGVIYSTPGTYNVSLIATNTSGSDTLVKTAFITVNSAPNATLSSFSTTCSNAPIQTLSGGSPSGGTYFVNGTSSTTLNPSMLGAGSHTIKYRVQVGSCSDSASQSITINAAPNVSASTVAAVCENAPSFTLSNGSPAGGSYSGTGVTGSTFNPSTAGSGAKTLKYTVTNSNNCSDSTQFTVQVNAKPNVSLSSVGPFCSGGGAITLTNGSPSGGNYSGPGVTGSQFDPGVAGVGTHTLKYSFTNSSGCSDSATTSVVVSSGSSATLSPFSSVCGDTTFTLIGGLPAGGTYSGPGVSGGTFNSQTAGPGTHTIAYTVTTSCGMSSATQSIKVDSVPNINVTKTVSGCEGTTFSFNASGATNYKWSPATGLSNASINNPVLTLSSTISYVLVGSHSNGCSSSENIQITVNPNPSVKANADLAVCIGDTFQLSVSGAQNYSWSPSTGLTNSTISNPQGVLSGSVTYIVTGTDAQKCTDVDTVVVRVKPKSSISHNSISDICLSSDPITLTGGTPAGGVYSGPGVSAGKFNPSIAGLGTHRITYTANEPGKCEGQTTVTITVLQSPNVVWNLRSTVCENEDPIALVSTPSSGIYSGKGVAGKEFNPKTAGIGVHEITYQVTAAGCLATEKREIEVVPGSDVDSILGLSTVTKKGKYNYQVNPINGAGYTWIVTGGSLLSNANNLSTIQWGNGNSGKIILVQTNSYGCKDTTELVVDINALSVGDEVLIGEGIILYPNPADRTVSIKVHGSEAEKLSIRLYNNSGQLVLNDHGIEDKETHFELNTSELSEGLYLLQTNLGSKVYSATLIIKH